MRSAVDGGIGAALSGGRTLEGMTDWKPRQHDSLVEPLFAGLRERIVDETSGPGEGLGRLWAFLAFTAVVVALRVWRLL